MATYKEMIPEVLVKAERWSAADGLLDVADNGVSETRGACGFTFSNQSQIPVYEGDWVLLYADGQRIVLNDDRFKAAFVKVSEDDPLFDKPEDLLALPENAESSEPIDLTLADLELLDEHDEAPKKPKKGGK